MKKTLATVTMALVLGSSTVFANGGLIIAGRGSNATTTKSTTKVDLTCTAQKDGLIIAGRDGLIIAGRGMFGAILTALEGILVSDKSSTCQPQGEGILVSDRQGILVSD